MISSFTIPTEAKLRKVKLYQARNNDGSPLNIAEIQVWVNNTNVASSSYNSNNSASSNNIHGSFPASNLIDNNLNNFAHTSSNSSINDDLIVTLSQNYDLSTIQSVVIYNRDGNRERLADTKLELLDENDNAIARTYVIHVTDLYFFRFDGPDFANATNTSSSESTTAIINDSQQMFNLKRF